MAHTSAAPHRIRAYDAGAVDFITVPIAETILQAKVQVYVNLFNLGCTLKRMATRDALTGIYNRLKLDELVPNEIRRSMRYKQPCSVVMLDIDLFKNINDNYGHLAGDQTLVWLAGVIKDRLRESDTLFRWGGEEFLIFAPDTELQDAGALAESVRRVIERSVNAPVGQVTCSLGVSQYKPGDTVDSLVQRADLAMYEAKRQGRNRVCLDGCKDSPELTTGSPAGKGD